MVKRWLSLAGIVALVVLALTGVARARPEGVTYVVVDAIRPGGVCTSPNADNRASELHPWKLPAGGLTYKIVTRSLPQGVSQDAFIDAIKAAADEWDSHTTATLLTYGGIVKDDQEGIYNGVSSVKYGGQVPMGAIAVAWVRAVDGVVAEADIRLARGFGWAINAGATGDCGGADGKMDLQDIVTHEFGHVVGAAHTPDDPANNAQTMYPYASYKELFKRSLARGDLTSLKAQHYMPGQR